MKKPKTPIPPQPPSRLNTSSHLPTYSTKPAANAATTPPSTPAAAVGAAAPVLADAVAVPADEDDLLVVIVSTGTAVVDVFAAVLVPLDFPVDVALVPVVDEAFEVAVLVGEDAAVVVELAAELGAAALLQPAGGLGPQQPSESGDRPKLSLHLIMQPFSSMSRMA